MLKENSRLLDSLVSGLPGPGALLDAVAHGIVVGDPRGRVVYCNKAALALHGFDSLEPVVTMTLETLAQSIEMRTSEGRLVPAKEWPMTLAMKGLAVDGEFHGAHPKRGLHWVARYSARPVLDQDGKVALVVVTIQEITDLRRAEESLARTAEELKCALATLRHSEQIYRAIGESIDYGVWVCAPDGRNIYASKSFLDLVGLTQEQCSDFGWGDVLHPDDAERTIAAWKECVRTQELWDIEHRFRGVDGKWHDILARGIPVKDEQGQVVCWAGINLDIRTQKQAQADLKAVVDALGHANHELEAFSYSVSHDLRAPVRAIDGFAAMLAESEGERLQPLGARYLDRIQRSSEYMGRLIDALLEFARVGRQELHFESVCMESLVRAAWEECREAAGDRRLELTLASPLPPARGDALMLHQVLVNLLGNAIKYSGQDDVTVVEVGAEAGVGETVYYVRDHGVGFDMKFVGKLFGVFHRLHAASEFEGTGVGLALVRRIVERHGGRVWAQAVPGEGATFSFTLK